MKVVTCPEEYNRAGFIAEDSIFLAGGISGCKDWQSEMIDRFKDVPDLTLINPRRTSFDVSNVDDTKFQIGWEHNGLFLCDAVLFWFPFHTLCPITLFELAKVATEGKRIFVGCHPAYARIMDVQEQLRLIRPDVKVRDNFTDLVNDTMEWLKARAQTRETCREGFRIEVMPIIHNPEAVSAILKSAGMQE